ncbi:ligand-gated channel [Arenicella chitinivorans]|uniref:Ligand-gated channel n=1 Tax=Arenicella chitinivorans TaxID=1329800 RepID=A0A918VFF7_9GAMM|nr:TonB-dependent receptor [Arenicella chitinivorans]GGZ96895.1 ligand-gated channel [Arenicella chitinivorans]
MNTVLKPTALFIASILTSTVALADDNGTDRPIEEISVWGTAVRASSLTLQDDAIAIRQADHISDLLRTIPGVDVGGAHSLNQRITIRSMDDKDLRITIDGANQNTYMYHHMGNLQIHADILEKVDVEVGTNSVVDGGLGGAVRFKTKNAAQLLESGDTIGGRIQASYGDNSGSSLAFTGFAQLGENWDVLAYVNQVDRDNYQVGGGEIKTFHGDVYPGTDGVVRGLEGELSDMLIKLGWDITGEQRVELGFESYQDEGDYSYRPDMGLATDLAITNSLQIPLLWPTEFTRDTLTLNYDLTLSDHTSIAIAAFTNESQLQRDESGWAQNSAFAAYAGQVTGTAENRGLNLLASTELGSHMLTYGAERIRYNTEYESIYLVGGIDQSSETATNTALFIQDRIQISDRFAVIPGVRYDQYDVSTVVVNDEFSDTTFSIAGEVNITDSVLVKLSTTELFKGPEVGEVFTGAGLYDTANPGIEAETGRNNEISLAYQGEHFSAGVTFFDTEIDNYIYDYAPTPSTVEAGYWKDNIGTMQLDGYEAYVGFEQGGLNALLTFSQAESELAAFTPFATLDGARLDRQQGDTISVNLDYHFDSPNLTLHWDLLSVDSVPSGLDLDGATLNNSKDKFTVHNVSMRWTPSTLESVSLTVGVDNVFDEYYASQSSRTGLSLHPRFGELYLQDFEPGRNIKATLSYAF